MERHPVAFLVFGGLPDPFADRAGRVSRGNVGVGNGKTREASRDFRQRGHDDVGGGGGPEMRFLVLNHFFGEFTGSEINAFQLCVALREAGHEADIGTFEVRGPMLRLAELRGIHIHSLLNEEGPALAYDVIWAHHAPVLTHVIFRRTTGPCRVIFSSLSPLTPLESPPTYFAELPLLLAHSPRNLGYLQGLGMPVERLRYFPNFSPKAFFTALRSPHDRGLRRMVVVSNHPPDEVRSMAEAARRDGVHVDFIGAESPRFVDETVLPGYDLVVTIGKTVQYAFAQRVPVYCYDHFGGPGYIDADNFAKAEEGNFCGRSFWRKLTADGLYADIRAGYAAATGEVLGFLQAQAGARFSLETNLARVCAELEGMPVTDLDGLRQRHGVAGRLNDVYMECLRRRLHLERVLGAGVNKPEASPRVNWLKRLSRVIKPGN